ncbi:MAG: aminotransferase class I/II-fold pyridoxal phosphate-dependent enzyme [Clostridia bacterium]|nr:aminotransferase class I/II-fold pyridoxal phosphate-dependent enzyme [Clostridia bacterium]
MKYCELKRPELEKELADVRKQYDEKKAAGLKLDMSRGRPSPVQSDLSEELLKTVGENEDCFSEEGIDCRNYGFLKGLTELRKIFAPILGVDFEQVVACGNSTLNLMYDCVSDAYHYGVPGGKAPWGKQKVKFLCPVPGYDRHFGITQALGAEMITVPMLPTGPDMDRVEELVKDESVKGIWCVPKYSNPDGFIYSDETVKRLANMKCAAGDFRIFWDNAYAVHDLYPDPPKLLNIMEEARLSRKEDRVFIFFSTSKITFAGGGVAFFAGSEASVKNFLSHAAVRTIGYDKVNQLRHARFFGSTEAVYEQMKKHAEILRPKFELVCDTLERELAPTGTARWNRPLGGYFVGLNVKEGTASRTYTLAKEAGVTLTKVGATYPLGIDPFDSSIRIAPSAVTLPELKQAIEILCVCAKLAVLEKMTENKI